jgi:AbiV family abortive infection protein
VSKSTTARVDHKEAEFAAQLAAALVRNAGNLLDEAQLLYRADRAPRAYALAALAGEELAKVQPCLETLTDSVPLPARRAKEWANHADKLETVAALQHAFVTDLSEVAPTSLQPWAARTAATKLSAFYVDHADGVISTPEDIDLALAKELIDQVRSSHEYLQRVINQLTPAAVAAFAPLAPVLGPLVESLLDRSDVTGSLTKLRMIVEASHNGDHQAVMEALIAAVAESTPPSTGGSPETPPHGESP